MGIFNHLHHVVGDDMGGFAEPELGDPVENLSLAGDAARKNHIEGRHAISGDDKEIIAKIVGVSHLSSREEGVVKMSFQDDFVSFTSSHRLLALLEKEIVNHLEVALYLSLAIDQAAILGRVTGQEILHIQLR
jgi:hypothetical protein